MENKRKTTNETLLAGEKHQDKKHPAETHSKHHHKKRLKWLPIGFILLVLLTVCEGYLLGNLGKSNMLPNKMMLMIFIALCLITLLISFLLFYGTYKKKTKWRTVRRVVACILIGMISLTSCIGSNMMRQATNTLDKVSAKKLVVTATIGVYALSSSNISTINDAAADTFGIVQTADRENTDEAVKQIEDKLTSSSSSPARLETKEYQSIVDEAQALYSEDVPVIILNESFVDVLKELDQFKEFDTHTKIIDEVQIKKDKKEDTEAVDVGQLDVTKKPFTIYISGSDTRSNMLDVSRSDVNILMTINPITKQILLLNTPRDYFVGNPAGGGALDKLTHLGIYGIDNSIQGLENLYNINIDYYAQINFTGFETLIDAVGGITVDSDVAFTSNEGYSYVQGPNNMNGAQALSFARDRYHQSAGDNDRGKHQMMVIKALLGKMTGEASTVLTHYSDILNSLTGMFVTSLSSDDMSSLVKMQLDDMASWNVESFAVTGTGGNDYTYSMPSTTAYVMYPNTEMDEYATKLMNNVINGDKLTPEMVQWPQESQ